MSYKAQLDAFLKERGVGAKSTFGLPSFSFGTSTTTASISDIPWLKVATYTLGLLLLVILILVVVHFTIRPIFRFKSGSKGFITIPGIAGADDGELHWPVIGHGELNEQDTIFAGNSVTSNYSMAIDLLFVDLNVGTNQHRNYRPVFLRYNPNLGDLLNPKYTVAIYMDPVVNDLYVQLRTTKLNNTESITIKNVVAKQPLRIGITVQPSYFEVYRNGLLVQTKTISAPPIGDIGRIWCNPGGISSPNSQCGPSSDGILGYGINLHLWRRALKAQEMQYSMPAMPTADTFLNPNAKRNLAGYIQDINMQFSHSGSDAAPPPTTTTPDSVNAGTIINEVGSTFNSFLTLTGTSS